MSFFTQKYFISTDKIEKSGFYSLILRNFDKIQNLKYIITRREKEYNNEEFKPIINEIQKNKEISELDKIQEKTEICVIDENKDETGIVVIEDMLKIDENKHETGIVVIEDMLKIDENKDETGIVVIEDMLKIDENKHETGIVVIEDMLKIDENKDETGIVAIEDMLKIDEIYETYRPHEINEIYGVKNIEEIFNNKYRKNICYCRVNSYSQKIDLKNQMDYMKYKYPFHDVFYDIGSNINYDRYYFKKIINYGIKNELDELVIYNRDILCRTGYELIESILKEYSNALIIIEKNDIRSLEELTDELIENIKFFRTEILLHKKIYN